MLLPSRRYFLVGERLAPRGGKLEFRVGIPVPLALNTSFLALRLLPKPLSPSKSWTNYLK